MEGKVAAFFEFDVRVETINDQLVNLFFELQKLLCVQERVRQMSRIFNDLLAASLNVIVEAVDDDSQVAWVSRETLIQKLELILTLIIDHILHTRIFVYNLLVAICD